MNFSFWILLPVVLSRADCELLSESDEVLKHFVDSGFKGGEAHQVKTDDGYLLKVHRIVAKTRTKKFPVFLMHGLSATSGDFIISGPKLALAYLLSDNGYDVWLGNARGSKYSCNHVNLSSDANTFWDFSWHEIGSIDLPAMIDYMLKVSKAQKALYVGHSQGTTALLVLLSTRPDYNKKIIQAHLLAPAAFMVNNQHPVLKYFKSESGLLDKYAYLNLDIMWNILNKIYSVFCEGNDKSFCKKIVFSFFGENKNGLELDVRIIPKLNQFVSPRISVKQVQHFVQLINSGKFQMFDYQSGNKKRYNSTSPPEYHLENVSADMYLYHGSDDLVISQIDVEHLKTVLPNVRNYQVITNWNHVDFLYGKKAKKILYTKIVQCFDAQKV